MTATKESSLAPELARVAQRLDRKTAAIQAKAEEAAELPEEPREAYFYPTQAVAALPSDMGNAARLIMRYRRDIRYCGAWGTWMIWDGCRWKRDEKLEILRLAKETALGLFDQAEQAARKGASSATLARWAARSQERGRLEAMIALARPEAAVTPDELDRDPFVLNVENCTIDLRNGEARPHRRENMITKLATVVFDPQAKCPRWDKFLSEIFDGNRAVIAYFQHLVGHCLTGDVSEQFLHVFHGSGQNGKSVLTDTLVNLLGDYAAIVPADLLVTRRDTEHPTELTTLCGRRLAVASESEDGQRLRISRVKALTGDSTLTARYMRADYFSFQRTHKLILVTNHTPRIADDTIAIWRRVRLLPFTVQFPLEHQDKDLLRKLRDEYSGILNWCVEGCLAWQEDGLQAPPEVQAATESYRAEEDNLTDFFGEKCFFDNFAFMGKTELYKAYEVWAVEQGEKHPLNRNIFIKRVRQHAGISETVKKTGGKAERVFVGVGLSTAGSVTGYT
jgi:putative DNA primase/helicase